MAKNKNTNKKSNSYDSKKKQSFDDLTRYQAKNEVKNQNEQKNEQNYR